MPDNFIEPQYDITRKTRLKKFYESNKISIFLSIFILMICFTSFSFYLKNKEKSKVLLSEDYIKAKIYLENGKKSEAVDILKKIIFANNSTYSTLSFFLLLHQDLIDDPNELSILFDHILENNNFEKEVKNLIIYKKAVFNSNFINESEFLEDIKPLLNNETLWKPHALLLAGDYFVSKKEYLKAKEFYQQIFSINNLQKELYDHAIFQLSLISND